MRSLGGDRLSLVASLVAIAFSFTSSTGRWRQLSSPQPVHQVQAAAASQSGRLMLTASRSPVAGNTHRFQPSTAEVNYLPAQYIPASTAITLQDQELCTVKPGQRWPKVCAFLRTPEPIYDADYISWLERVGTIPPGVCWIVRQHTPSAFGVHKFAVARVLLGNASLMLLAISGAALAATSLATTLTIFACGAFGCASAPTLAAITLTITPLGPAFTATALTIAALTTPFVLTTTAATAATIVAAQLSHQQQWPATESFPCPFSQPALASIQARRRRHWHNVKRRAVFREEQYLNPKGWIRGAFFTPDGQRWNADCFFAIELADGIAIFKWIRHGALRVPPPQPPRPPSPPTDLLTRGDGATWSGAVFQRGLHSGDRIFELKGGGAPESPGSNRGRGATRGRGKRRPEPKVIRSSPYRDDKWDAEHPDRIRNYIQALPSPGGTWHALSPSHPEPAPQLLGMLRTEFYDESPLQGDEIEKDKARKARTANRASSAKKRLYETDAEAAVRIGKEDAKEAERLEKQVVARLKKAADSPATRLANKEQHQKKRAANQADPEKAADSPATRLADKEQHQKKRAANQADPEKAADSLAARLADKEQHQKKRAANQADPEKAADSLAARLADKEQHKKKRAANQADPEKAAENAATRKKDNEQHKDKRNKERAAGEVRQTKVTLRHANMTEAERRAKKQLESGSRFDQDRATRLRDERLRVYRQRHPENGAPPIRATWPPPAPARTAAAPSDAKRLDDYIGLLGEGLVDRIHTCPNCNERDVCHGVPLVGDTFSGQQVTADARAAMKCWRCTTKLGRALHWSNGLDLDLSCDEHVENTSKVPLAHRLIWQQLQLDWGELSVLEEALVSRVVACTSVLKLPVDDQLGYKSSVINYINDTADVVQKLPRAPKDSQVVVYQVPGAMGEPSLQRVRKHAVRAYLCFFAEHHPLYKHGIIDPLDSTRYLVAPFDIARDFDYDEWNGWADEFIAELHVLEASTAVDADAPTMDTTNSNTDDSATDATDPNKQALKSREGKLGIPTAVLLHWLRHGIDPASQNLRAQLRFHNLNPSTADDAERSNVDFQPLIDHFAALEYVTKYAAKAEKGSGSFEAVLSSVLERSEEQLPTDASARRVYAAVLSQVVGGRNWSAQEVGHVNMGCNTVVASHKFETIFLAGKRKRMRADIQRETADDEPAFQLNYLDRYLLRMESCATSRGALDEDQPTLLEHGFEGPLDPFAIDLEHVADCSFTEFWRTYSFTGDGPKKRTFKVRRRLEPTVVNIKPRLPRKLLTSKDPQERQEYCRVQLLLHRPFLNRDDYDGFMVEHDGDFVAAYEGWAKSDSHGPKLIPACVTDDFRELHLEVDGEHLNANDPALGDSGQPRFSADYSFYRFLGKQQLFDELEHSLPLFSDWNARTKQRYSAEQIKDADRWMQRAKAQGPEEMPAVFVDIDSLNPSQRFIYNVVHKHAQMCAQASTHGEPQPPPLNTLICGTAGSGKTYLIGALKQLLQESCLVCAPTGVAADNIGGVTYHSKLPMPRDKRSLDIDDVRLDEESTRLQRLEEDFEGVEYLIIDEMSMVGRRSLGMIDHLLQQAKGSNAPFGGVSVLFVGDHGQLPPVKDHRAFDWEGVRHRSARQGHTLGEKIGHAPFYQYHGTRQYELLSERVFFLDKVERIAHSDDPVESQRLQHFQELQLRARDGELTEADYTHMVEHMDASKRPTEFEGHNLYHLVTTRKLRDSNNLDTLERQIRGGAPGIAVPAVHSSPVAERAVDDDIGLARSLILCIGARVMVTKNISVVHGLCNGTIGTVYDVMCNDKGVAVSVLLRVKKRTLNQRGYAGQSFLDSLPEGELPLADDEAIIALDRWEEMIYEGGQAHTRAQFPIMLAWCVTIHKAQGLTLDRVLIDAGSDERAMGQLFVALTRVRHPDHVAFSPMPPLDRVTTLIARKKSLHDRKRHERHLRLQAARTATTFALLQPNGFELGAIPPEPPKYVPSDPSERQTGRQKTLSDWKPDAAARAATQQLNEATQKKVSELQRRRKVAERQLEVNRNALSRLGLPPTHQHNDSVLPHWLLQAHPMLKLTARVVDYLPSRRATEVCDYLQRLGFNVELDTGAQQIGNTCGVVAAWVAVELKLAHLDQPNSWVTTNLAERFDPHVYCMSNLAIGLDADDNTSFISGVKTIRAAQEHWTLAMASRGQANTDVMEWLSQPETLDFAIRQIVTDLHNVAAGQSESIDLRIRVSNTDDCRSTGTHWFTVAYSIQIVNDDVAAWDAVHATITADLTPVTAQEVQHEDQTAREFYGAPGQAGNEH